MTDFLDNDIALANCVWQAVHATPAVDYLTGLRQWRFTDAEQNWGIDALLTAPDLVDALFRCAPRSPDNPGQILRRADFDALPRNIRADMVWRRLFAQRSPLNEAARGVLTVLGLLQFNPADTNLDNHRAAFAKLSLEKHWGKILGIANLSAVTVPCDPLRPADQKIWNDASANSRSPAAAAKTAARPNAAKKIPDVPFASLNTVPPQSAGRQELPNLQTALDLDNLLAWDNSPLPLNACGLAKNPALDLDKPTVAAILQFLGMWFRRAEARHFTFSWCSGFSLSAKKHAGAKILRKCVLPFCERHNVPLVMVFGGRARWKNENQPEILCVDQLTELCGAFPQNRFLLTATAPGDQITLITAARRNPQITILGGISDAGSPAALSAEMSISVENLSSGYLPFASNATTPEQLLYRWAHARWTLGKVLQAHYAALRRTGWRITEKDIRRDIAGLLQGGLTPGTV